MGDFNNDLLKLDLNDNSNSFINLMFSSAFYPTISKPTRITKSTATLIDNIFSNTLEEECETGLLLTDLSDHLPVFQLNLSEPTCSTRKISQVSKKCRIVNDKSINALCRELNDTDFTDVCMCTNPVYAYNLFYVKLVERYDKCLPTVSVTENYICSVQKNHG